MSAIRIHLGPMPTMLRSIITDLLSTEQEVEIVGMGDEEGPSLAAARAEGADVLLVSQSSRAADPSLAALLEGRPRTVLMLKPDHQTCVAVTLTRREYPVDGEDLSDLAAVIRKASKG